MKKHILILIFIITASDITCQNLSLSELLKAREMTIGEVEEYLTKKEWKFFGGKEPTKEDFGFLNFAFNVGLIDRAESWIYYFFSDDSETKRIAIHIFNEKKYNEYLNQIKNWGGKMIDSKFKDKEIVKIYKGSTMTYVISTGNTEGVPFLGASKQTVYSILTMTNEDYMLSKE
jgi:hypothetical protein